MKFLIAESEPPEAREARRDSVGKSLGETYIEMLNDLAPGLTCDRAKPADADSEPMTVEAIAEYDAVFLTGSPLHIYDPTPEAEREIDFMRRVFASGTPSFGSCAGLQVAAAAAGGKVREMEKRQEAGFARRITPTDAGRDHPLLRGRPAAFDAPAIHGDEVAELPPGATLLAGNTVTAIQAAEIRYDHGIFWGVQYHPELSLAEIAAALRRQSDDLIEQGLARCLADIESIAASIDEFDREPGRADLAWRLGLDRQVSDVDLRRTEIRNFVELLVMPVMAERGRSGREAAGASLAA
jgi:GMP synthase (glutamine-hydrolysing)